MHFNLAVINATDAFPQGAQQCHLAVGPVRRTANLTLCEIADRLELMAQALQAISDPW